MTDETRHEARLHLTTYAVVGLAIIVVGVMAHVYNSELTKASEMNAAAADKWAHLAAEANQTIEQLKMERDEQMRDAFQMAVELNQLTAKTTERIVVPVCVEPDPVPVFSRDSQLVGTER